MEYKIKKGDRFLCLENYFMYDTEFLAYTKDKIYFSEVDNCITDNKLDTEHEMNGQDDFFDYFSFMRSNKAGA